MANSSVFPSSVDQFQSHQEIQQSDKSALQQYQALISQTTPLTPDQETTLQNLTNQLRQYLVTASDIDLIQDAITNTQQFFLTNVNSYFDNFQYLGQWSQSTSYQEWNTVTFNNQSYLSLKSPNLNNPPDSTPSYWALIAKQGGTGPQGPAGASLSYVGTYNNLSTYQKNQLVSYNGSTYICLQNNTTGYDPTNTTYWTLFVTGATPLSQSSAPTNPVANQLWIDTTTAGDPILKYWDATNSVWVIVSPDPTDMAKKDVDNAFTAKQTFNAGVDIPSGQTGTVEGVLEAGTGGVINATELSGMAQTDVIQNRVSPNIVENGDFEEATTTATVFSDALTSYSGSTVPAPWTLQSGSFTFGTGGATSGAANSYMTAGNSVWKPVLGSDGTTKLAQTSQVEVTQPSTAVTTGNAGMAMLWQDANHYYLANVYSNTFQLQKYVSGTYTTLASIAQSLSASTSYFITLSLDNTGLLTAKLYQGTNTSGTLLQTLTATDTSLTGGFLIGVGGDTGVVISNASVTAPWANSWSIDTGQDQRVAWGLTYSAISGKYSISAVGVESGVLGRIYSSVISISPNTNYTYSLYANTSNVGVTYGAYGEVAYFNNGTFLGNSYTPTMTGTNSSSRTDITSSSQLTANQAQVFLEIKDSGTVTFDNIQLEQGSTATPYIPQTQHFQTPIDVPSLTIKGSNIVTSVNGQTGAVTNIATTGINNFNGNQSAPVFSSSGINGLTTPSRYVGATVSGYPTSGTFQTGDYIIDQTGIIWVCFSGDSTGGKWASPLHFFDGAQFDVANFWVGTTTSNALTTTSTTSQLIAYRSTNNPYFTTSQLNYYLDVEMAVNSSSYTVYAQVWNDGLAKAVSPTLSTTSTTPTWVTSSSFNLVNNGGPLYLKVWVTGGTGYIVNARIYAQINES